MSALVSALLMAQAAAPVARPARSTGAAEPTPVSSTAAQSASEASTQALAAEAATAARMEQLENRLLDLESRLATTEGQLKTAQQRISWLDTLKVNVGGYVDVGFFAVQGDGSGVRQDFGHTQSEFADLLSSWVLLGDPLSTAINSRGDVADVGASRAVTDDALKSKGRPTFLVNAVNLSFRAQLAETWFLNAVIDFLPRERFLSAGLTGDLFDVKIASLKWQHTFGWGGLAVVAGKFDSILGVEYRTQEASERLTITPSLLCRYTCGRPVGVKARATLLDEQLELLVAVTNGSAQTEQFLFSNETDFNLGKTVSARVGVKLPVLDGLDVSASGAVGAQDRQSDDRVIQWHVGAAVRLDAGAIQAQAEFIIGRSGGKELAGVPCAAAGCLQYKGAYALLGWRLGLYFIPYARVDWRSATLRAGREYAYASDGLRATVGMRVEPFSRLAVKAEYTFNRELNVADFPDDIFTTSVVLSY